MRLQIVLPKGNPEAITVPCAGYFGYPLQKKRIIDISTRTYSCHLHIKQVARKFLRRSFFPGLRTDIQSSLHRDTQVL
jgi:hypothetical protein